MTAALVLVTRRLPGTFQYIGGQRTGTTNIETGTGKALRADNPWDALGYQAVEEAVTLFDHGSPAAAALLVQRARRHATGEVAEALETFEFVIRLYAEWDRFEHGRALEVGSEWRVRLGRLGRFFPPAGVAGLEAILGSDLEYLRKIVVANRMSRELVLDLVANAMRRMGEQRFDDAVARLYRATEALGQTELWERHSIDAGKVRLEQIPEKLRRHYERQGKPGRPLRLGLRQDYELLRELGNPLGLRFRESVLSAPDEQSPLGGRNRSILAHGFRPLADPDANHLLKAVLELAEVKGADLPLFPKLGEMLL